MLYCLWRSRSRREGGVVRQGKARRGKLEGEGEGGKMGGEA